LHRCVNNLDWQQKMSNTPNVVSVLDALIQAIVTPRRPEPRPTRTQPTVPSSNTTQPSGDMGIVDRRDERGVKRGGDFPNPTGGSYKGCF
jgi:hypothetical protein